MVEDAADVYSTGSARRWTRGQVEIECGRICGDLMKLGNGFFLRHQEALLQAIPQKPGACFKRDNA
jgi:hypothetical protein